MFYFSFSFKNFILYLTLFQVAELVVVGSGPDKERREIIGAIRGCIKTVTCGTKLSRNANNKPLLIFTKLAYISGLRVSPSHRYDIIRMILFTLNTFQKIE